MMKLDTETTTQRSMLWLTVAALTGFAILAGLGTWQINRLAWKQSVIANIQTRIAMPAVPLPVGDALDPDAWQYRRVAVRGRFLHEHEMHVLAHTQRGNVGYDLITPLQREDGGYVLVNRGWVPQAKKQQSSRPQSLDPGVVVIEGIAQKGWAQAFFVPDNNPVQNLWFFGDIPAMAANAGISAPRIFVEAAPYPDPTKLPLGGQTRLDIPNNHLQYAITWYSLAAILAVFYILIYRRRAG